MYYSDNRTNPEKVVTNAIVQISGNIFCLIQASSIDVRPQTSNLLYMNEMHACDMSILIKKKKKVHVCLTRNIKVTCMSATKPLAGCSN